MNYIDTFSTHQNATQERKQAWYTAVSILLIAAKGNAQKTQLSGNRFFGEFPWEVLLDRERLDEFFQKNETATGSRDAQAVIAKASDLWQWVQRQVQAEMPDLWNKIERQKKNVLENPCGQVYIKHIGVPFLIF